MSSRTVGNFFGSAVLWNYLLISNEYFISTFSLVLFLGAFTAYCLVDCNE